MVSLIVRWILYPALPTSKGICKVDISRKYYEFFSKSILQTPYIYYSRKEKTSNDTV